MAIQQLISHLNSYFPLTNEEMDAIAKRVVERKIRRRQFILQEGDICKHYNFIVSGCLKMFSVDSKGKEHNVQFGTENNWMTDIGGLHGKRASNLFIEAVEASTILQIALNDLVYLYHNHPRFNIIFRVIIENSYSELQERMLQNISKTAEERYLDFLNRYPGLSQRLPNIQIASYLGITPEFLSNIRKKISVK